MLQGNYYFLQGYQLWRFCKSEDAYDLFSLLQNTKDSAGNVDCNKHMKHEVSGRLQDSCLLGGDAGLLVADVEDHSTLLCKSQGVQDHCN